MRWFVLFKFGDYDEENYEPSMLATEDLLPQRVIDQYQMTNEMWARRIKHWYADHKGMARSVSGSHLCVIMELCCVQLVFGILSKTILNWVKWMFLRQRWGRDGVSQIAQDLGMYGVNYFQIRVGKWNTFIGTYCVLVWQEDLCIHLKWSKQLACCRAPWQVHCGLLNEELRYFPCSRLIFHISSRRVIHMWNDVDVFPPFFRFPKRKKLSAGKHNKDVLYSLIALITFLVTFFFRTIVVRSCGWVLMHQGWTFMNKKTDWNQKSHSHGVRLKTSLSKERRCKETAEADFQALRSQHFTVLLFTC